MNKLKVEETKLEGGIVFLENKFIENETSQRINWLIKNHLKKMAADKTGWFVLYKDPNDNRYWELSYLQSESHGGGSPVLKIITESEAKVKYKF
jgi:hypothetical protein